MKIFTLFLALLTLPAAAQTKLISHKSHSGSMATFNTALENNLFDIGESNFGLPGKQMRFTVDSIILLPDNRAVVISSEKDVYRSLAKPGITFKPKRDTLYNHPLLSKQHAKDSILRALQPYDMDKEPVLINYDNDKTKKNNLPVIPGNDTFPNMPLLIFALALLSALMAFIS